MSHNSVLTGTLIPNAVPSDENIEYLLERVKAYGLSYAFTVNSADSESPGTVEVFAEFSGQKAPEDLIKSSLNAFMAFVSFLPVKYSGIVVMASYDENEPDEETETSCVFHANKLVSTVTSNSDSETLRKNYRRIWAEAYAQGVADQITSASMPGVAGCFCDTPSNCVCFIAPARANPYD